MPTVLLTHTPDMLANYYGPRALAALRALCDVRLNETGTVLVSPEALAKAAQGCAIIVSDRQTPAPAEFFAKAPAELAAFLRVAIDIRNIDVAAASKAGILVTHATAGFIASVAEQAIGYMIDLGRHTLDYTNEYRAGGDPVPRMGRQLSGATLGILGYGAIGEHLAPTRCRLRHEGDGVGSVQDHHRARRRAGDRLKMCWQNPISSSVWSSPMSRPKI